MANNNGDYDWLNPNNLVTKYTRNDKADYFDRFTTSAVPYHQEATINDITGSELLEVIQKGLYKTLVGRRDDAKAVWEEEDDDASYGEYNALKGAVELLDAFLKQAPQSRFSTNRPVDRDRYDGYGRRY